MTELEPDKRDQYLTARVAELSAEVSSLRSRLAYQEAADFWDRINAPDEALEEPEPCLKQDE